MINPTQLKDMHKFRNTKLEKDIKSFSNQSHQKNEDWSTSTTTIKVSTRKHPTKAI